MILPAFVRRCLMSFFAAAVVVFCLQCDYRGKLVDANDPIAPLFTIKGKLSAEISSEYFTPQKSARIGLMPQAWDFFPDELYDNKPYISDTGSSPGDTVSTEYPSVSFTGGFPMNFVSRFNSLPVKNMTSRFLAPSGKVYRLGIYCIVLFDDVDKNGIIRIYEPKNSADKAVPLSDRWIGVCRDYFLVYLEDASILAELNPFITERLGGYAVWEGLKAGFNLVSFTSKDIRIGARCYSGVRGYPDSTELQITPFDPDKYSYRPGQTTPDFNDYPLTLLANSRLFFFQRFCWDDDNGGMMVTVSSGIDTIYLKTRGDRRCVRIYEHDSWPFGREDAIPQEGGMLEVLMSARGLFDYGYYSCWNPYMVGDEMGKTTHGRSFVVNGHSCADSSELTAPCDTIAMESDTLSAGFATGQSQPAECRAAVAPIRVDTFYVNIRKPSGAAFTIKQVQ